MKSLKANAGILTEGGTAEIGSNGYPIQKEAAGKSGKIVKHSLPAYKRAERYVSGVPLVILFLVLWQVLPVIGILNPIFFPTFSDVITTLQRLIVSGVLAKHVGASLFRALIGFLLAVVVALPLGFLMGRYSKFEKATDLLIQAMRNTSQFALLPVFIMLLGIGEASKIAITFYASVWFLLINTISGVKNVDPLLIKAATSMGTSEADMFKKVIFPSSFPSVVAGARLGVKASLMSVIGAEMLAAKSGLGFFIQNSQLIYRFSEMYAGILVLCVLGLALNYFLVWIEKKVTAWKVQSENITG